MEKAEKLILTAGPSITEKEIAYVNDAVSNGWNEKWNEYIIKFQEEFSRYIGVKHALATSSCTGAMHLGLKSFGIKENDEVIVPEITWIATASAVTYVNAKPVFVDIEEDTWCINPESIRKAITSKTKAIIPVHLYGHPANMDEIMEISEANNLIIIEDAAPSLGASYKDKKTGSFGDCSAFSFQGAKTATTGEGGILLTNNSEKFQEIEKLGDHGRSFDKKLWNDEIGFKYKMSNIQAALGLAQLERIDELVNKKRQIFSWYKKILGEINGIRMNIEKSGSRNTYWMSTIIVKENVGISREDIIQKLKEWNIDSRPTFYPLSHMPMFDTQHNKNAENFSKNGINLPSGHNLEEKQVDYICEVLKKIIEGKI